MIYLVANFLTYLGPGKNNDKTYGTICLETLEADDLCLRDLGYFDLETYKRFMMRSLLCLAVEVEYAHLYQEP